ncbi:uroporphyrinogen-III C-methyltransferase [Kingella kingae]|uniref:Uroporphyrin-III C-methyltransferase n=2 Tax=Kingella kingae TaxID=504 RepID=F5S6H9_KINKI|nr:uroporphyrinogen-III C-methyltransferase [Kingella kingae]EGK10008.1 uroporphyrin-III C-methyltransferase [Kingella kingae ATCC 23330]MDK4534634.1 uroporphyrinogen-III C-methyltransferase [Kingella kingae]MDK4541728.1 uroporphyrinogen-III C-methyltransferase [Kingella kingae]MDK4553656.1 uroporphyrinogen-III C-methyltransferase [Kingella kingae]UOP02402.1 uroporphyrinogen-III C-methyltransferase [Kingella kingae]
MTEAQKQPEQTPAIPESNSTPATENASEIVQAALPATTAPTAPAQAQAQPIVIEQTANNGGKSIALGALVLAILSLGASGFLFVQGQNILKTQELSLTDTIKTQELRFNQELDKAGLGNSQNATLLQAALQRQQQIDAELAKILANQNNTQQTLDGVQRAYAELLKGRVNWLVDEVEVTLNVASQQLLLSGNVPVAISVLETVEQRLNRFEQPELLPIKQAISQDLAALKNRPYLNTSATALRLDRLQSAVPSLPLLVDNTLQAGKTEAAPVSQAGNWWTRATESTVNLLKSMVEVRKLNNNDAMLIAPEQVYFVRENLRMHLLDARLAVLQHNGDIYQNDLNAVEATVKQYFDVQSPNTQAWLKELNELKALEVRMISDDALKSSLAAVRTHQNSARTALPVNLPAVEIAPASVPTVQAASVPAATATQASEPAAKPASAPATKSASQPASSKGSHA